MKQPTIVTVTGPSSSGKTVLSSHLHDHGFETLVSTTTRPKRRGEVDDVHYHFTDVPTFKQMEREHKLIESITYDGNHYGVSSAEVERAFDLGRPAVLVVEPHGVEQIRKYCAERDWKLVSVFVYNPLDVLLSRMIERALEDTRALDPATEAEAIRHKIDTHSKRIAKVVGSEQKEWVEPAVAKTVHYDLVFDSFNDNNREAVVAQVEAFARLAMEAPEDAPKISPSRRSPSPRR
jgi:guanylate kinase